MTKEELNQIRKAAYEPCSCDYEDTCESCTFILNNIVSLVDHVDNETVPRSWWNKLKAELLESMTRAKEFNQEKRAFLGWFIGLMIEIEKGES